MRDFNDADRIKKKARIQLPENPDNLSAEKLKALETKVKSSVKNGALSCGAAHKIAQELGVSKMAVGVMTDKLGVRVAECQIGCFKVEKIIHAAVPGAPANAEILTALEALRARGELTCENVFRLAAQLQIAPMAIAEVANDHGWKISVCQLGCF